MSNKNKLLVISSLDKISQSNSNSDFIFKFGDNLALQNVRGIYLNTISVPNVFYNVRDGSNGYRNNTLLITENGFAQVLVTVPQGQYLINDFLTALDLAINALMVGSVVTSTLDPLTKKIVMTFVGNTVILDATSTIAPVLGLSVTTADQLVHTMDYLPNLNGLEMVYVHSLELARGNAISDSGNISVLDSVSFNNVPFGAYATKIWQDVESSRIDFDNYRNLTFVPIILRDDRGNKLNTGTHNMSVLVNALV